MLSVHLDPNLTSLSDLPNALVAGCANPNSHTTKSTENCFLFRSVKVIMTAKGGLKSLELKVKKYII